MHTPFSFGRMVHDDFFTNREKEIRRLSANFENGINTMIISPRRWGKSSLVEKVASAVSTRNRRIVRIDLFGMRTEEEFYNALANGVIRASGGKTAEWLENAKRFLRAMTPKFTVELADKQQFSLQLDLDTIRKHYRELLDLPEKLAAEKKLSFVICIDEFQNISTFKQSLSVQKKLRSAWQGHRHVTYCLYGSKKHMMTELFSAQSNPFYKFGEVMFLPRIEESKWVTYIQKQFQRTRKKISSAQAGEISRTVRNHPYYVQQLSHLVWINTTAEATAETISQSINELLDQNALLYFKETENLNNTEIRVLRAVCAGEEQLSAQSVLQKYQLGTSAGVVKAKRTLISKEVLDEGENNVEFVDPVYELWFRRHIIERESR